MPPSNSTPTTTPINQSSLIPPRASDNSSGQGSRAVVPEGVRGWSWGAFGLSWVWGIFNNTFIALLVFLPIANIVMPFVLGVKGREWAWQNKYWSSVEEFNRVQRLWSIVWLITLIPFVILPLLIFFIVLSGAHMGSSSSQSLQLQAETARSQALVGQIRFAADMYYRTHQNYGSPTNSCQSGMFTDTATGMSALLNSAQLSSEIKFACNSNGTAWAVSATIPTGGYWCSDSTKLLTRTTNPLGEHTSCQ